LLIPGTRQAERLVPRRKLDRTRPGFFRQGHGQHLQHDALHVVLGLLRREAERIDLHAVAEAPLARVGDAVAILRQAVPEAGERLQLADLLDEADAGVDEEGDALDHVGHRDAGALLHPIEDGEGVGEGEGQLLHRRRAGFLQVVGADVHRIPLRQLGCGEDRHVLDQPHRRRGRKHVGAARQVFLDDVVLNRALQRATRRALLVGDRDVERHQPRRGGVDGHRGVHGVERDLVEQRPHVAEMADRDADLAHFAGGEGMVGVVAGLGREIEGDGKAGLAFREVLPVQRIRLFRRRMPGIGADDPGLVAHTSPFRFSGAECYRFALDWIALSNLMLV
jgi:hypothetical protein